MDEASFLAGSRTAIVGLGLMGGSLALALRGHCAVIYGIDPDPKTLKYAQQIKCVDEVAAEPNELLGRSDIIILAAPVREIISLLGKMSQLHRGRPVILDLGSTKAEIVGSMNRLPERFQPIGGHPICGKENSSIAFAESAIYKDAPFILCTANKTSPLALQAAQEIIQTIGSKMILMEADEHDRIVAATSHFPYLLANLLSAITPEEAGKLVGPGFRSTARLSGSSTRMMLDILLTNRGNILEQVRTFQARLVELEQLLEREDEYKLKLFLDYGMEKYRQLVDSEKKGTM